MVKVHWLVKTWEETDMSPWSTSS